MNMRLPDKILNTVCFIAASAKDIEYGGTAFVVAVKGKHGNAYLHLVTAKHVAEMVGAGPFVIGANRKVGGKALIDAAGVRWYCHPTESNSVDAAVTLFAPNDYDSLEVEWVFEGMFTSPETLSPMGLGIGDEIAVIGLFTRFSGKDRHFPIVRIGNLAMLPSEPIPVKHFEPMEVYLAEGRSIGGLSGSPVFIRQTVNIDLNEGKGEFIPFAGCGQIYFLGLMHGHWEVSPQQMRSQAVEVSEAVNMGVSIIVPAHKIMEIIYQPELVALRRQYDDEIADEMGPVAG
jgi:hypothetical protein